MILRAEQTCWGRAKVILSYLTQHIDEAFLFNMREVIGIQATTKFA